MPTYKYKAISVNGQSLQGTFVANSRNDVIQMLRGNNSYPVMIQEDVDSQMREVNLFGGVRTKDLAVFCRQSYSMLNAGVPIINCLDILRMQTEHKKLKNTIGEVYENVQKGLTFSESLKKHLDVFPELLIYMIEAGEASGSLDTILERMAVHYEKETKINSKIKGAMVYPIILSIVSVTVVIFLLTFVMPTFIGMFQGSGVPLPLPTRILMKFSELLKNYWYLFLSGTIALIYGTKRYILTSAGRLQFDRLKLRLPVIGSLNQKIITARFARTLSTLMASGIPLLQAMENVANVVGNKVAADGIMKVREEVRRGAPLAPPVKRLGIFPPMVDNMIHIGEESGTLDDILEKTANFYDEEVEASLQKMITLFEPVMILVMGLVIGFIVIAMVLPMFDMLKTVQ
ncbi:type II secretion system F family protein [Geosporobacter ferrireducens]|uniref:Type II secretion system protein F n=1 Tax=Geosporobacter ferrireducens TaxID=1424294 RepID=A0A1D8GBC7_9FIRM|nr:type II secretion system F family protein [Geosporobacter ferrireducens]AOT68183.1 type II secretion system protein F [Geosporobacter ferrireducens]MTI54233.1 type II secretion system F family protein [Geosporobacter ferrireducens]